MVLVCKCKALTQFAAAILAIYNNYQLGKRDFWTPLVLCDLQKVAAAGRMEGQGVAYAWLLCCFMSSVRGKHTWELFIRSIRSNDTKFVLDNFLTTSDEAFILLMIEAYREKWTGGNTDVQEAAWEHLAVSALYSFLCELSMLCVLPLQQDATQYDLCILKCVVVELTLSVQRSLKGGR